MEEKHNTIVNGKDTGEKTESGNYVHNADGTFGSTDNITSSQDLSNEKIDMSEIKKIIFGLDEDDSDDINIEDIILGKGDYDEELEKMYENILYSKRFEISEEIESLNYSESFETVLSLDNIDKDKIGGLYESELKEIIQAKKVIEEKNKDDSLSKFNKETFPAYELWPYEVKPSNYEKLKNGGNFDAKLNFFQNDYLGSDKQEKIDKLKKFQELGERYIEEKKKFDKKYSYAQDIVDKYFKEDELYSENAKDNAIWIKSGSMAESKKIFQSKASEVIKFLKSNNPTALEKVIEYTGSYKSINNPLRRIQYTTHDSAWKEKKTNEFLENVKGITYAIDQSTYDKNVWLQRGVDKLFINNSFGEINYYTTDEQLQSLIGTTYKDHAFQSCGAAKGSGFTGTNIIINTYCPKGTKMMYLPSVSHFSSENEMLLQRGYTMKITKAEKSHGTIYLDVEVLLGTDSEKYNDEELEEISNTYF